MGQKTHPSSLRLGLNLSRTWDIQAYSSKKQEYSSIILKNLILRKHIESFCSSAQVSKIISEVSCSSHVFTIFCKRPGIIIGSGGSGIEDLKKKIANLLGLKEDLVVLNIREVANPDLEAVLVADSIVSQLQKRISFRKAMKRAIQNSIKSGAVGIKVACSGRLAGAEIARTEKYMEGKVPLHTLRADIDHAQALAHTPYGVIGTKVWIYRSDKIKKKNTKK